MLRARWALAGESKRDAAPRSANLRCPRPARRVQYGECYFEVSKDRADELLETRKEKASAEIADFHVEIGSIEETLATLKKQLYSRFGGNINLEEQ